MRLVLRLLPLTLLAPAAWGAGPASPSAIRLVDAAAERGLAFTHDHGGGRLRSLVETTGGGTCVLDLEGDGDPDVYFVNGGVPAQAARPRSPNRLFRNADGRFTDVTEAAGVQGHGFGMGCVAADVDGDGDEDLFVTNAGPDELFLNDGAGRFREVAAEAGLADPRWTTAAAFADADGDGDLDLFVGAYVDPRSGPATCPGPNGLRILCRPTDYRSIPGRLYRNEGPARSGLPSFRDVTSESGIADPPGNTLAVLFEDLTGDGLPDLALANDMLRNTLLVNVGSGRFRDATLASGIGWSDRGLPEASMGLDAGDLDGDGQFDLVVTNFQLETNTVLRGTGAGRFDNVTDTSGVGEATLLRLAFGVTLADFDLDSDLDIVFANGHVDDQVQEFDPRATFLQLPQVLENRSAPGRIQFTDVTSQALAAAPAVGRGSALLDVDGDLDLDVVVNNLGRAAQLLENRSERAGRRSVVIRLRGPAPNGNAIGALVTAEADGRRLLRRVRAGASFASCSTRDVHFGLGESKAARVAVTWPDGTVQDAGLLAADELHVLRHPSLTPQRAPAPPARPAERP